MGNIANVKKRIITSMIAILLLILTLFGITYAYFTSKVKGNTNDKSVEVTAGRLELTYKDGNAEVVVEKIQPGELIKEKTFTVENTGTGFINDYEVVLENVVNELKYYEDLTYELTCSSSKGTCNGSNGVFPIYDNNLVTNSIDVGVIHSYTLKLYYAETNLDQSDDMNKTISAKVNIRDSEVDYTKLNIYGNSIVNGTTEIDSLGTIVSDKNDIHYGKYKIDITAIGKNLLNINDLLNSSNLTVGSYTFQKGLELTLKPDTNYILSSNLPGSLTGDGNLNRCIYFNNSDTNSSVFKDHSVIGITDNIGKIKIGFASDRSAAQGIINKTNYIQLEEGDIPTPFEPYTDPATYSIYIKEPLRCLNSTCDYIDFVNKKLVRKVKSDNSTLSLLSTPIEENVQVIDTNKFVNKTLTASDGTLETSNIEIETKKIG